MEPPLAAAGLAQPTATPTAQPRRQAPGGPGIQNALLAAAYALLAWASLQLFATLNASASPVWPPSGLAVGALLVFGRRLWPGVLAGAFLANVLTTGHWPTSIAIAAGNTLEALAVVGLFGLFSGQRLHMDKAGSLLAFIAAALVGPVVSASVGVGSLWAAGLVGASPGVVWLTWWLGDAAGALVFAPLIVLWAADGRGPALGEARRREWAAYLAFLAVVAALVWVMVGGGTQGPLLAFVVIPLVVWPAVRFGPHHAALANGLVTTIAVFATLGGTGLFAGQGVNTGLLLLQAFLVQLSCTSLLLAATIRERASAEDSARAAREAEQRFHDLVDSAPDATLLADETGRIVLANRQAEALFGYPRLELAAMNVDDLMPQRFKHGHAKHRADYHASPRTRPMGVGLALFARRKDGSEFPVEISLGPITGPHGSLVAASIRDITARRKAEDELEVSRRQLAATEKLAALGTLVAGVGHEVRTPLTYIATNLALIRIQVEKAVALHPDLAPLNEDLRHYISKSQDGVKRIDNIVRQLRQVSKSEIMVEAAGLDEVVQVAVELFRATHKGGITVELESDRFPPFILDKGQLQQVIINLLNNAAEAMEGQGVIHVRLRQRDGVAVLEVEDHGPGMSAEVQKRLFDPFFTTKAQGTGLGLPISRRIVEAHGGTMTFTTAATGTTFKVTLPPGGAKREGIAP